MAIDRSFLKAILDGERIAVARGISLIENEYPQSMELLKLLFPHTGTAYRIGITGPPGAGKSTITSKLAKLYREQDKRIGIIAVDPTSPFTGGALLGDRVRMTDVDVDAGVFIRSMASRGSLGGLSRNARGAADILDASGCDVILMETVGVGQSELDVARAADTVVVVLVPESGDAIQAMKAGLMEIADFFVLNKSDRAGADQAAMSIKMVLAFKRAKDGWNPDVIQAVASEGKGVDQIAAMIASHRAYLEQCDRLVERRAARIADRIQEFVRERLQIDFWTDERRRILTTEIEKIHSKQISPYDLAERLLRDFRS